MRLLTFWKRREALKKRYHSRILLSLDMTFYADC